jgi:hypothetical protein
MGHVVHVNDFRCFHPSVSATFVADFYFRIDVIFATNFLGESINSTESTFKSILFVMSVHAMRVHLCPQPLSYFFSQILFVWLITPVSYCHLDLVVAFFMDFVCRLGYLFFI